VAVSRCEVSHSDEGLKLGAEAVEFCLQVARAPALVPTHRYRRFDENRPAGENPRVGSTSLAGLASAAASASARWRRSGHFHIDVGAITAAAAAGKSSEHEEKHGAENERPDEHTKNCGRARIIGHVVTSQVHPAVQSVSGRQKFRGKGSKFPDKQLIFKLFSEQPGRGRIQATCDRS
jgi:hypothetical protein